jgi:glucose uptake protein GlcU
MMGIFLCICTAGALLVLRSLKGISRFVEFTDFGQWSLGWFALMFLIFGIITVISGARLTSLDTQNKLSETIAKVEGEISVLKTKLEARTGIGDRS